MGLAIACLLLLVVGGAVWCRKRGRGRRIWPKTMAVVSRQSSGNCQPEGLPTATSRASRKSEESWWKLPALHSPLRGVRSRRLASPAAPLPAERPVAQLSFGEQDNDHGNRGVMAPSGMELSVQHRGADEETRSTGHGGGAPEARAFTTLTFDDPSSAAVATATAMGLPQGASRESESMEVLSPRDSRRMNNGLPVPSTITENTNESAAATRSAAEEGQKR